MSGTHRLKGTNGGGSGFVGKIVGGYRLLRLLGRGGMGLVFEGVHEQSGHSAAVKIIHGHLAQNPAIAARFHTEARAAGMLHHPGVVRIFDVGQTDENITFIIMEYVDGVLLADRLAQLFPNPRPLDPDANAARSRPSSTGKASAPPHAAFAICVARQLAETLSALHEQSIVHRDLKPDNIFLIRDSKFPSGERIKIFDFGLAKLLCDSQGAAPGRAGGAGISPQTAFGTVLGTPVYMSPEQWSGRAQITDRVDVYAAGGILYELFVGHPPFLAEAIGELMTQHMHQAPPAMHREAPWVPELLVDLVSRMLAKSAMERPSMRQVADILHAHQQGMVSPMARPKPTASKSSPENCSVPALPGVTQPVQRNLDFAMKKTQILPRRELGTLPAPRPRLERRHPQAPAAIGVFLACVLGLFLTGATAWILRHG